MIGNVASNAKERLSALDSEIAQINRTLAKLRDFTGEFQGSIIGLESRRSELNTQRGTLEGENKVLVKKAKAYNELAAAEERASLEEERFQALGTGASAQDKLSGLKRLERQYQDLEAKISRVIAVERSQGGVVPPERLKDLDAARTKIKDLQGQMSGLNSVMAKLNQALGLFFRYAVAYQVLYTFTNAVTNSIKELLDFQNALIQIKSIASATRTEMRYMTTEIRGVAEATAFSLVEVAKGGQLLVQAGIDIKDFGATLKSVAQLAAATGSTFQQSADVMTTFLSVFKEANPGQIADELRNAVNISKLSVGDLSTISNYLAESGKSFSLTEKTILAAAATLRNSGIKASTIGTGLAQALNELLSPDAKTLKALEIRYKEIGEALSQEEIKGMFTGFQNAKEPLTAALDELQRIGFGGAGAEI